MTTMTEVAEPLVQISPRCACCGGCATFNPPTNKVWTGVKNVAGFLAVLAVSLLASIGFLTIGTALAWHHLFG
jgi:hypothetical protein